MISFDTQKIKQSGTWLITTVLVFVCILFFVFGVREVYRTNFLFSKDPGYHLTIAKSIDAQTPFNTSISTYAGGQITIKYPSLLRLQTVIIHKLSGIEYVDIYKLFGLFTRLLAAFAIFITIRYLTRSRFVSLIGVILFFSSRYVFFRGLITFPENLALPFHILLFYDVVRSIRERKTPMTLPLYAAASLLVHFSSGIIPVLLISLLIIVRIIMTLKERRFAIKHIRRETILRGIVILVIFFIFSFPVINLFIQNYLVYAEGNIGSEASYAPSVVDKANYIPPSVNAYIGNIGIVLSLFTLISIPLLFRKFSPEKLILFAWLFFTFILSRGSQFHIYVPTDRMRIYLIIPAVIASSYFVFFLFDNIRRFKPILQTLVIIILIFLQIKTMEMTHGWQGITDAEVSVSTWVNDNITQQDDVIIFNGVRFLNAGFERFSQLETRDDVLEQLFEHYQINDLRIEEQYPDKKVFLVATDSSMDIFGDITYDVLYDHDGAKVFQLQ